MLNCFNISFRCHRRISTGNALLLVRSHVACVSKLRKKHSPNSRKTNYVFFAVLTKRRILRLDFLNGTTRNGAGLQFLDHVLERMEQDLVTRCVGSHATLARRGYFFLSCTDAPVPHASVILSASCFPCMNLILDTMFSACNLMHTFLSYCAASHLSAHTQAIFT